MNLSVTCHFPLANLTHKAVTTQLPYVSDIFFSGIGTKIEGSSADFSDYFLNSVLEILTTKNEK